MPSPAQRGFVESESDGVPRFQFQAVEWTGLSVSQEVAVAIFTAPTRTFYRKVQLQYKQNVRVWLVS